MSQVIAFLPLRCGSKSIPFKNIRKIAGRPLVYWILDSISGVESISKVVIATDCEEIATVVKSYRTSLNVEIFNRSKENAQDESTTESVILEYLNLHNLSLQTIFITLQATSPLLKTNDLAEALSKFMNFESDSVLSVCRLKRFIWSSDGYPINYSLDKRPRRQDFNGLLVENGAFYISTVGAILKSKNRISGRISLHEMHEESFFEVDEPDDFILIEQKLLKLQTTKKPIIKAFFSDIDGTLTDGGMYYDSSGEQMKKFNTRDGMAFSFLKDKNIITGVVTTENSLITKSRFLDKLKLDYIIEGVSGANKLQAVSELTESLGFSLSEVAYIGDDINCVELLNAAGVAACPKNAVEIVKSVPRIIVLNSDGGNACVREFVDLLTYENLI
jgi:YrbI family 3-deoxy-D-manno-octulosonate 8-phosphate phosphatase